MKVKIKIENYKVEELKSIENKLLLDHTNRIYKISDLLFETETKKLLFSKVQKTYITNIVVTAYSPVKKSIIEIDNWSIIESFIHFNDFVKLHESWKALENDLNAFGFDVNRIEKGKYAENIQYIFDHTI